MTKKQGKRCAGCTGNGCESNSTDIEDLCRSSSSAAATATETAVQSNPCKSTPSAPIQVDVLIVGAGVIGCSIARELAKYEISIAIVESATDVAQGASKGNSGIVHGGYDAKHGTLKSKLSHRGNRMYAQLNQELNFGYKEIGSMVLAFNDADKEMLQELYENGLKNGVDSIQLINAAQIRAMEPDVSLAAKQALYCPHAGIASPYELTIALAENAIQNGVQLFLNNAVSKVIPPHTTTTPPPQGSHDSLFTVETYTGLRFHATKVINCAGLYSDVISRLVGAEEFTITPRKGEYVILNRMEGKRVKHVLFQAPTKKWGKGILVTPTVAGNLMIGPSASDIQDKNDKSTSIEELAYVAWAARRTLPSLEMMESFTSFAGLRAKPSGKDFIIEESKQVPGFVNVAGIESPGLTSSPAIAEMVRDIVFDSFSKLQRQTITRKENFNPYRPATTYQKFSDFNGQIDHPNPALNVICRCEKVTEGEIVDAIHRGVPITSTDSLKWRTRAGMGTCQGNFCQPRVAALIERETGVTPTKRAVASHECDLHPPDHTRDRVARGLLSKL